MSSETTSSGTPAPLERRLATILCADIAGYSRKMGADEERTVRVFRGHREIFESLVAMHRGRIFNTAGDALLAEFQSAVEAVRCATEIQAALRTRNEHLAPEERMLFRIGINLGDVILQGGDLLGDGVNVAARIQAATEPGGICISGSVHDQIQNKLSLDFKLLGEQSYKNIAKPVRTYTIAEGAAVTAPARRTGRRMLAAIGAALLVTAGAGYWGFQQFEARLATQKEAAATAQREAEEAKRQAELQAQKLAADEALRRTQEERSRLEQDRQRLAAERRAAEATKRQAEEAQQRAAAAAARPSAGPAASRDGSYGGQLCNNYRSPTPQCWPVILVVRNGAVEASWLSATKKTSMARGTLAADGGFQLQINGWKPDGEPNEARLSGRLADGAIKATGRWKTGLEIGGQWKLASSMSAAPRRADPFDGRYDGQLCNQPRNKAPSCWPVELVVRNGTAAGSWLSRTKNTSRATGTVAADGKLELHLSAWTRDGKPIDGTLSGRISGDSITVSGRWRDNSDVTGSWKRRS